MSRTARGPATTGFEVHREPGPPRLTLVVRDGRRVAELEVAAGRTGGRIRHEDGWEWRIEHPPGSEEWWVRDEAEHLVSTAARHAPVGERCDLTLADGDRYAIVPVGRWWTRRWSVRDVADREVLEVVQRRVTRPVHDLTPRSGDLPRELAWVVAWLLAERLSRGQATTRRTRWGISTAWGGEPG